MPAIYFCIDFLLDEAFSVTDTVQIPKKSYSGLYFNKIEKEETFLSGTLPIITISGFLPLFIWPIGEY